MDKKLAELWKQKYYEKCTEINKLEQENRDLRLMVDLMENIPKLDKKIKSRVSEFKQPTKLGGE